MKVRGDTRELSPEEYSERIGRAVAERVRLLALTWQENATSAPPEEELIAAVLTLPPLIRVDTRLADRVGPFYDTAGVRTLLGGVSKQAVATRRSKGTILALRTVDGVFVYPVFQFEGNTVNRALVPAIRALHERPCWSAALWFVTDNDDLEGLSPLGWVKAGLPAKDVEVSAARTAAEWA